ncbi:uncharacterized protein I303_102384 [Kwoniella dejecticola CBS 10117]|uniref:Uncharacterized protein n=1 Tax=Kwoniella dejecticola CBS 10117 TaxID=1296121 RepID=A0AAJ8KLT6_9TREE
MGQDDIHEAGPSTPRKVTRSASPTGRSAAPQVPAKESQMRSCTSDMWSMREGLRTNLRMACRTQATEDQKGDGTAQRRARDTKQAERK